MGMSQLKIIRDNLFETPGRRNNLKCTYTASLVADFKFCFNYTNNKSSIKFFAVSSLQMNLTVFVFDENRITGCPGGSCVFVCLGTCRGESLVGGLDEEWLSCNYKSITCPEVTVDVECEDFNV